MPFGSTKPAPPGRFTNLVEPKNAPFTSSGTKDRIKGETMKKRINEYLRMINNAALTILTVVVEAHLLEQHQQQKKENTL